MDKDITPDAMKEILDKITGPEGIQSLRTEVRNSITNREHLKSKIDGEINAFKNMLRLLDVLVVKWGLENPNQTPQENTHTETVQKISDEFSKEKEKRIKDGKCLYKASPTAGDGKWCQRKLRTKAEKEAGYCKTHMRELGLLGDEE